jgi:hypothetical protein
VGCPRLAPKTGARTWATSGPSPLHRQSFAPVWMAPAPQQVLEFMLAEVAEEVVEGEAVAGD